MSSQTTLRVTSNNNNTTTAFLPPRLKRAGSVLNHLDAAFAHLEDLMKKDEQVSMQLKRIADLEDKIADKQGNLQAMEQQLHDEYQKACKLCSQKMQ